MPVASSKASLRSSRQTPLPAVVSANIDDSTTSMHLGKRSRHNTNLRGDYAASKRQKLNNLNSNHVRELPVRDRLPTAARKHLGADRGAGLTGASRIASAVQPPSNGTITTPQNSLTNGESQTQTPIISASTLVNSRLEAEKRTLRSHDGGSRSKSELAQYFPNFDEIVSNEPKEVGTHIYIRTPCIQYSF